MATRGQKRLLEVEAQKTVDEGYWLDWDNIREITDFYKNSISPRDSMRRITLSNVSASMPRRGVFPIQGKMSRSSLRMIRLLLFLAHVDSFFMNHSRAMTSKVSPAITCAAFKAFLCTTGSMPCASCFLASPRLSRASLFPAPPIEITKNKTTVYYP